MRTNEPTPGDAPTERNLMELSQVLRAAVDRGASDIHLKVGRPPVVRFDGSSRCYQASRPSTRPSSSTS